MSAFRAYAIIILALLLSSVGISQVNPASLRLFLDDPKTASRFRSAEQVRNFYEVRNYEAAWLNRPQAVNAFTAVVDRAGEYGLSRNDYQVPSTGKAYLNTLSDSLLFETLLTDAAIHFYNDLAYGNVPPQLSYNGLAYHPGCHNIPELVSAAIYQGQFEGLASYLEPKSAGYRSLKRLLRQFSNMEVSDSFKDIKVSSAVAKNSNLPLLKRMVQLGVMDTVPAFITPADLVVKIREVQQLFGLNQDGVLRSHLISQMNLPLAYRCEEIRLAMNTLRWLGCLGRGGLIAVNIPTATLMVFEADSIVLESKIIVGKSTTRTPTLSARVNEVILYPYWMVPKSIATKEILPILRRNPGYLDANAMQVLNKQGRVVNPYHINWHELSASNFPYVLRQSTGCDNSLGLIKLNFYNPFNVYMHDTPAKNLFSRDRRYFSHGCMRVAKAMELGHLVLQGNTIAIDTLEDKGCLRNQSPIVVPATRQFAVMVLYNTAWIHRNGSVSFGEDVYGKLLNLRQRPRPGSTILPQNQGSAD